MKKVDDHIALLNEQKLYYQARASEYNEWFFRQGRYDRGRELNEQWFAEIQQLRQALDAFKPLGHVLEIACGTGLWTEQLMQYAEEITSIDAAREMLAICQTRMQSSLVQYIQADIFDWTPKEKYDVVFFAYWLSHVPPERFTDFWELVDSALLPDGRVFFIDQRYDISSTAKDHHLESPDVTTVTRRLNDGREFRIIKVFYDLTMLSRQLAELGWQFEISETSNYFIYGSGCKRDGKQ